MGSDTVKWMRIASRKLFTRVLGLQDNKKGLKWIEKVDIHGVRYLGLGI